MTNLLVAKLNNQNSKVKFGKDSLNDFDKSVIDAANKVHAQKAKGKLVSSSILSAPFIMAKDTAEDVVAFKNALAKGKSDDYRLGRINDLSLKLGSLAIAGYLFTKKGTSTKKWMEFVGFGSFFASMALWPKLFIQLPAKLLHGVDVFQEYEDSQGRRKKFFQDPQYIPWDIMTPEQMSKLGDKLNVPKDIKNRSDITKEKAHKIALQSNTLWMLSAGFGVPIMSAFICSGIEKYLPDIIAKSKNKAIDKKINSMLSGNFESIQQDKQVLNTFNQFISSVNEKTVINDSFIKNLSYAITGNEEYASVLMKELKTKNMFSGTKRVGLDTIDALFVQFEDAFANYGIDKKTFIQNYKKYENLPEDKQIFALVKALKESGNKRAQRQTFDFARDFVQTRGLQSQGLSKDAIEYLRNLNATFARISNVTKTVDEFLSIKTANTAEALATKHWQNFSNALVKTMNLSPEKMKIISSSDAGNEKLISDTLTQLFKDNNIYDRQMELLLKEYGGFVSDLGLKTVMKEGFKGNGAQIPVISALPEGKKTVLDAYSLIAKQLRSHQLDRTASFFTMGINDGDISKANSIIMKNIDIPSQAKNSAFLRSLLTMDFLKRKADNQLLPQIKQIASKFVSDGVSDKEASNWLEEAEKVLMKGELGDYITKFSAKDDSGLNYKVIMDLLYNPENLSESTKKIFTKDKSKATSFSMLKTYMNNLYDTVGNIFNPHYTRIHPDNISMDDYCKNAQVNLKASVYESFVGDSLPSMLKKTCDNILNTSAWVKKFAAIGITAAAITVISQFFFGMLKDNMNIKQKEGRAA